MEKLKSVVPENLKSLIAHTHVDDLPSTSSSLLDFLLNVPHFHQMIQDLADPQNGLCGKNKSDALELKQKGNKCFLSGDYSTALNCYSQALRVAPKDAVDTDKNLVATLFLNRATLLHKMGLLMECLRDCDRALQIVPKYAKAWYRRGKANVSLGNYKDAVCDLNVAKNAEFSLAEKKFIEKDIKIIVDQQMGINTMPDKFVDNNLGSSDEHHQIELLRVTTPDKGRGMVSTFDIPQATLIHKEEPYSLIISKSCRETHCHYCLNELPADVVPCLSCSIPLYCSQDCQVRAGGGRFTKYQQIDRVDGSDLSDLAEHITKVTLHDDPDLDDKCFYEHKHECLGVNWPSVLPADVVLAGRMLQKPVSQRCPEDSNFLATLDLSHNYSHISPEGKLESLIYATVLLLCIHRSFGFELPIDGVSISKTVILLSQIRVNSMAVIRMKSAAIYTQADQSGRKSNGGASTSSVEQVQVGQAIYLAGSMFNHSCQPNIHAYFLSRSVLIRTTEFVATGSPLELSYGPQVGEWDFNDRLEFLQDKYGFGCQCSGCTELNLPDLAINAFRCVNPNCAGVVLDQCGTKFLMEKLKKFPSVTQNLEHYVMVEKLNNVDNSSRPFSALELCDDSILSLAGCCLKCSFHRDLEASNEAVNKAKLLVERVKNAIASNEISGTVIALGLRALCDLRSVLHAYNKGISEAEDFLAQAFCLAGDLHSARDHCKASIEILEKLYGPDHIVIGHELLKLSTIQLSLDDRTGTDSIDRLNRIFSRHYGSHAEHIFPYLRTLRQEACSLVQSES